MEDDMQLYTVASMLQLRWRLAYAQVLAQTIFKLYISPLSVG